MAPFSTRRTNRTAFWVWTFRNASFTRRWWIACWVAWLPLPVRVVQWRRCRAACTHRLLWSRRWRCCIGRTRSRSRWRNNGRRGSGASTATSRSAITGSWRDTSEYTPVSVSPSNTHLTTFIFDDSSVCMCVNNRCTSWLETGRFPEFPSFQTVEISIPPVGIFVLSILRRYEGIWSLVFLDSRDADLLATYRDFERSACSRALNNLIYINIEQFQGFEHFD